MASLSLRGPCREVKSGGGPVDISEYCNQVFGARLGAVGHGVDLVERSPGKKVQMKVLTGRYPKLALVALIVSIALASGAAKKWN